MKLTEWLTPMTWIQYSLVLQESEESVSSNFPVLVENSQESPKA